ncbi:MAG: hypothetical protein NC341_02275 [Blautia sp.]|nr:hypothetical protein [Blautia sp.]MCM1200444.1 hypothetical protein [Bacteroides fragilis]
MRKKMMKGAAAAAMTIAGVISAVFPVLADSPIKSGGNLVYGEGEVSLHASDLEYLYAGAEKLQQEQGLTELPDTPEAAAGRKEQLSSRGVIQYADGAVVMDASDFGRLADWMDGLERAYADSTAKAVEALGGIGTFFRTDGSITHEPEEAADSGMEAGKLPYSKISDGISQSQSVTHLAEQQIGAAAAGNLSRGTAAWVDGKLLIGNGADNDACYQKGYSAGEAAGYQTGYGTGVKDAEANVNPSSASYQAGYAQGKADFKPVILTGAISDFPDSTTELRGSVQIPAGLTYVCAGIQVTPCKVYEYPKVDMWAVDASWNYNRDTGIVSFKLGIGGEKYLDSHPVMNYTIMYIP